ncbi:hypothetical protein AB0F42_24250 [Streptomyces buecherae]|uniref:hypothetical protein n=1 Tax=Streptomyces buecherae TaxID=2763006 RepID=UPI0033CCEE18
MPEQQDALTALVQAHVGQDRTWSIREFAERAIDPETGWSPSKSLIGKIASGQSYTVSPPLVSALAAGLELPRDVVAAAAHFQLIGYEDVELQGQAQVTLRQHLDRAGQGSPKSRAVADRWAKDDSEQ